MAELTWLSASADPRLAELGAEASDDGPALAGPPCRSMKAAAALASVAAAAARGAALLARDLDLA
jgi:hypothetical protein